MDCVKLLLHYGANTNSRGANSITPLMLASITGNAALMEILCQNGADTTIVNEETGSTLLHDAIKLNRMPIVQLLLQYGASTGNALVKIGLNVERCKRQKWQYSASYSNQE
jgi:ankyrin repeat protein